MAPVVLIADSDRVLCTLYERFLSRNGWQVRTSGAGLACLAQMRQAAPRVLILDLHLPWGGADGLLAVMRDDPRLAHVPVILTSTDTCAQTYSDVVLPPVVQVLRKPFSLTVLLELMCSEMGNEQLLVRTRSEELASPSLSS